MGIFDTIYAELDCPFCGRKYRHAPLSHEQASQDIQKHKQQQVDSRQKFLRGEHQVLDLQELWAKQAGFEDVAAWINQLDSPVHIEAHRTRRHLGLAEIQTKEFDNILEEFYVGDEVPKYSGHYYIPEAFQCAGFGAHAPNLPVPARGC